jgi:hypothetical protein
MKMPLYAAFFIRFLYLFYSFYSYYQNFRLICLIMSGKKRNFAKDCICRKIDFLHLLLL